MLKGFALLLLSVAVAHTEYAQPQLSGLTTYEMMPDVTTDEMLTDVIEEDRSEEPSNKIIPDEHDLHEHADDLEEFLEVTAKCGYTSNSKETTLGSVSWNAKHEEIDQNFRLFAKTCESLRREARNLDSEWTNYKTKHAKSYESPEEDSVRRELYFKRKADIEAHNLLYSKGLTSYSMGLNHFSDMRLEEMGRMLGGAEEGYGLNITFPNMEVYVPSNLTLPQSADWRRKGAVTPVKNQGHCGSCWAFSTTGGIEGQWKIHHGQLPSLSEQQLVDCSHSNPNHGCHGGNVIIALNDIQRSGGIESEQAYPYYSGSGHEGYCRFDRRRVAATVNGYVMIPSGNEGALQDAVANQGPVSVMIHVSERFYHYRNGVFDDPPCVSTGNHAILAVGYGVQYGRPYWLVKNSWGPGWGFQGFGLMSRNRGNQCIIATFANYPRV